MRVKEGVEAGLVGAGEGVATPQQQEPGSEHLWVEGGLDAVGLAALDVAAHRGEPRTEPSDDVEAVQHVAGTGQAGVHGGLVGARPVGDDDFDSSAPLVWL